MVDFNGAGSYRAFLPLGGVLIHQTRSKIGGVGGISTIGPGSHHSSRWYDTVPMIVNYSMKFVWLRVKETQLYKLYTTYLFRWGDITRMAYPSLETL